MINKKVPLSELNTRIERFRCIMDLKNSDWKAAIIFTNIHLYYFTGTMQKGMLYIPNDDEAVFWVYNNYERAKDESLFPIIKPMSSYREAQKAIGVVPDTIYLETEMLPIAFYNRIKKYFPFNKVEAVDDILSYLRARKSCYELDLMKQSGIIHKKVMEEIVPSLFEEGMNEVQLASLIYSELIKEGHQAISRLGMFDTEMILGNIGFGESSIYPTYFNGPGGNLGLSPAVPLFGNRERKLKKGDLVFIDIGCGYEGYHTDKTMVYTFLEDQPDYVIEAHLKCVEIQNKAASMLKVGAIPSQIYKTIMEYLSEEFLNNFMGYGTRKVNFLGHGIGLWIDEKPVIAKGYDEPIEEGMVFAIEPKKGIKGIGMVGVENTFVVSNEGGKCITGNYYDINRV